MSILYCVSLPSFYLNIRLKCWLDLLMFKLFCEDQIFLLILMEIVLKYNIVFLTEDPTNFKDKIVIVTS